MRTTLMTRLLAVLWMMTVVSVSQAVPLSVVPLDGTAPDGRTYGELTAAWVQWMQAIPADVNPVGDMTGEHALEGQSGDVYFLAGTFGNDEDTEVIRIINEGGEFTGKSLFFPVLNGWFLNGPGESYTDAEMRALAEEERDEGEERTEPHGSGVPGVRAPRTPRGAGSQLTGNLSPLH